MLSEIADSKVGSTTAERSTTPTPATPNPKRVAAGKLNRTKRKGLTPEGRERLRRAALVNQPWRFSSGPTTPEGRAKVALNGLSRQKGAISVRKLRAELTTLATLGNEMKEARRAALGK